MAFYLTDDEIYSLSRDCHCLLSPLHNNKPYGTYTGTGSLGDAISSERTLILPSFVDPFDEFSPFTLTYSSSSDLSTVLTSLSNIKSHSHLSHVYQQYSSRIVFRQLRQLNIF